MSRVVIAPGATSDPVAVKAHRLSGTAQDVSYAVTAPAGPTATPASGTFHVDQVGSAPVTITAPTGTPDGRYAVTVSLKAADGTALPQVGFTVVVGQPNSFFVLREGVAISADAGDHTEADYDGGGVSYSRQALAAAGLTPGGGREAQVESTATLNYSDGSTSQIDLSFSDWTLGGAATPSTTATSTSRPRRTATSPAAAATTSPLTSSPRRRSA